jgi:LTXXQ motif family protein
MGPHGRTRFCDVRAVGLSQWRTYALTQMLDLNKEQQAALTDLSAVSAKALVMISATCQGPSTDKSQLAVIQSRVETLLDVLKAVRPAYEAFYAKLDDNQKLRLDSLGPRRNGWRW